MPRTTLRTGQPIYEPAPVPQQIEDLPLHVQEQLEEIANTIRSISVDFRSESIVRLQGNAAPTTIDATPSDIANYADYYQSPYAEFEGLAGDASSGVVTLPGNVTDTLAIQVNVGFGFGIGNAANNQISLFVTDGTTQHLMAANFISSNQQDNMVFQGRRIVTFDGQSTIWCYLITDGAALSVTPLGGEFDVKVLQTWQN